MAFKLVFITENFTGVYEKKKKVLESSESNIDNYATMYHEIANYKPKVLTGLNMAMLWTIFNNCMHMNSTTYMAVSANYWMLRNMKEATQLKKNSRFSILMKEKDETNVKM